jgi:hypothetical protein
MHPYPATVYQQLKVQGGDLLLTIMGLQKTLHRQIGIQLQGIHKIHFLPTDHEVAQGRDDI